MVLSDQNITATNADYLKNMIIYNYYNTDSAEIEKPKPIKPYKFIKDKDSKKLNGKYK